jgi:hypothetical protein
MGYALQRAPKSSAIKEFADWVSYFKLNRTKLASFNRDQLGSITKIERATISRSIATFQLGESSEGRHLLNAARKYALRHNEPALEEAMKLFIAEEQRHARDLALFMSTQRMPLAGRQWTDTVFRTLRRLWNLEVSVTVLLTAELVARVYYKALKAATASALLQQICAQLLRDETAHVHFHTTLLASIRSTRPRSLTLLQDACYRLFHHCTLLIVWIEHGNVLRSGGFHFRRYWKSSRLYLDEAMRLIHRIE